MRQRYFYNPFAVAGDRTTVTMPPDTGGAVSYDQGWTPPYQDNLATNPSAIAMDRLKFNSIEYDITYSIQALQQYGTPEFINTTDNQGTAFAYDVNALVRYSLTGTPPFSLFQSLVTNNTVTPINDNVNWSILINQKIGDSRYAALAGLATQTFNVATATTSNNAVSLGQHNDITFGADATWSSGGVISLNVVYINATDKPIAVSIVCVFGHPTSPSILQGSVNNSELQAIDIPAGIGSFTLTMMLIVPPQKTYEFATTGNGSVTAITSNFFE